MRLEESGQLSSQPGDKLYWLKLAVFLMQSEREKFYVDKVNLSDCLWRELKITTYGI